MSSFRIESLQSDWIAEVARIHMRSLPDDFLPGLGFDFLRDVFYPAAMNSPYGCVYVAVDGDNPIGFVIITKNSPQFLRSIIQNQFWGFFLTGIKTSFSSFRNFRRNLEILASLFSKDMYINFGELYEMAISSERQGQGIGKALVNQSIDYLKSNQIPGIKIKTQKTNTNWIGFFLRNGWQLTKEIQLIDNEYIILSLKF
jgi:ribosomal protein S18 acetylase RimI-like enzyme